MRTPGTDDLTDDQLRDGLRQIATWPTPSSAPDLPRRIPLVINLDSTERRGRRTPGLPRLVAAAAAACLVAATVAGLAVNGNQETPVADTDAPAPDVGAFAETATVAAELIDQLQIERAMAQRLVIAGPDQANAIRFGEHHAATDAARGDLAERFGMVAGADPGFIGSIERAIETLDGIGEVRASVLAGGASPLSLDLYTDAVGALLDANDVVATTAVDPGLARELHTFVTLGRYRELMAQESMQLFEVFSRGRFEGSEHADVAARAATAEAALVDFRRSATEAQLGLLEERGTDGLAFAAVVAAREQALTPPNGADLLTDNLLWLGVSLKVNSQLAEVQASLAEDVIAAAR